MSVRITGGVLRGRLLPGPPGNTTRPTTDMWRSSIFDALAHHIELEGSFVIDLFAGTGSLGFEALSRGASHVTFVEKDARLCKQIESSAKQFSSSVPGSTSVICDDVFNYITSTLAHQHTSTLLLSDPPYHLRCANQLIDALSKVALPSDCYLLIEHSPNEFIVEHDGWSKSWEKEKGQTAVTLLCKE